MEGNKKKFKLTFNFVMPAERVMQIARDRVDSPDENYRSVAKALLDVTAEAAKVKDALTEDRDVDVAPYLDFWFADAVACATKLLQSDDPDARDLAQCLIDAEKATIKSKECVLAEIKRLGLR
jgi:hypothetical protein